MLQSAANLQQNSTQDCGAIVPLSGDLPLPLAICNINQAIFRSRLLDRASEEPGARALVFLQ
jgi:hypothetical protein